mgnify:CR=1 FL=1
MDLNKSRDFFDPAKVKKRCHIIGCGSIGSHVAELLARYGIETITLYDFDTVAPHNLANQNFYAKQIGMEKTEALKSILLDINPDMKIELKKQGYMGQRIAGFVFICVDNIEVRKQIVQDNINNPNIVAMFDFRTTLEEGQNYFADWSLKSERDNLFKTMNFTHEEAKAITPVSACGFELSVSPVVKDCAINGVANFTNFVNGKEVKHLIISRPYDFSKITA